MKEDGRRTTFIVYGALAALVVLLALAFTSDSPWAAVGALVVVTPVAIALVLRWIGRS